jgi:hypothetical protein
MPLTPKQKFFERHRVREFDGWFYPEHRVFGMWYNVGKGFSDRKYLKLEEARAFIMTLWNKHHTNRKPVIIHEALPGQTYLPANPKPPR